jgi:hypothetical protein
MGPNHSTPSEDPDLQAELMIIANQPEKPRMRPDLGLLLGNEARASRSPKPLAGQYFFAAQAMLLADVSPTIAGISVLISGTTLAQKHFSKPV